ncbi:MAG TPA: hypothetical protein VJ647_05935 [Chitinophagaceae bacterium]|nr:hypothetical protein [Chitinophagaceae bacterium]
MPNTLKQDLIDKISATEDEHLLQLLSEDLAYYTHEGKTDITDELTESELAELRNLAGEPDTKDTISWEEYKEATKRWR